MNESLQFFPLLNYFISFYFSAIRSRNLMKDKKKEHYFVFFSYFQPSELNGIAENRFCFCVYLILTDSVDITRR